MTFAGERYYNIYRVWLTTLGLWPYQKPTILHTTFIFCTFISYILFQFTTFLTSTCNFYFFIREFSYILPTTMYLMFYNMFYFNADVMKHLWERIKFDWNAVEGINEIRILEKYAYQSHLLTLILFFLICMGVLLLLILELLPVILDAVAPMNMSRPRKLKVDFELFLDQQQYFYIYLAHEMVTVVIGFLTLVTTGTTLFAFIRHCCANYKIASNILENTVTRETLEIPVHQRVHVIYRRIYRAVHIHRRSLEFCKYLLESVNKWFSIILAIIVLSLSCNLLRLLYTATLLKEIPDAVICGGLLIIQFVGMYVGNFMGQSITDHSAEIFHSAYKTMWYVAPLSTQKLLLLIMRYSLKSDVLIIGGIFVSSLEGFTTLVTTSLSYFTVIHSIY